MVSGQLRVVSCEFLSCEYEFVNPCVPLCRPLWTSVVKKDFDRVKN